MKKLKSYLLLLLAISIFSSCDNDDDTGFQDEMARLNVYLEENNITTEPTASGLYIIKTLETNDVTPLVGDRVFVHYKGYLLNGEVFDSSLNDQGPFSFQLMYDNVILGWHEGIAAMRRGEKATLIIPSNLAYGSSGAGSSIPGYSTLIFEVELVGVQ